MKHLKKHFDIIKRKFLRRNRRLNSISWSEFNQNQKENAGKKVILEQKDFDSGTLRIFESCWLVLKENI